MLKPSDIEQKTFSTALRGYDLNEVDDFLDEVIATIRDLEEQVASAASGKPSAAKHDPVHDESAVGRALIAAQTAADRILDEAREAAERIRGEARTEADSWVSEREAKKAEADREMAELTSRVSHVRRELAVLATAVADGLDEMDAAIDTARHSAAAAGESLSGDAFGSAESDEVVEEVIEVTEEVEVEVEVIEPTVTGGVEEVWPEEDSAEFGESWDSTDSDESADSDVSVDSPVDDDAGALDAEANDDSEDED